MFQVDDLSMTYDRSFLMFSGRPSRPVLYGVSFRFDEGERIGLLGVNGAGKTTLIKLLLGILKPTAGRVSFAGHDSRGYPNDVKARLAVIFAQKSQLWWNVPVADSLRIIGLMYGADERDLRARIARLEEELDLGGLLDTAPRFLSFGQRMRCEVAASLVARPAFLFLDEAFIGLDPGYKRTLHAYLRNLSQEEGTALFFASHDLEYLDGLVDRVIVLDGSRLALDTPLAALEAEKARSTQVRIRFGRAPMPQELVRLNALTWVFPDARWEVDAREQGLVKLDVPVRFADQVDFIHAFLREAVGPAGVEFKERLTIRDILDDLGARDAARRAEQLGDIIAAADAATGPVDAMQHISRLRPFTAGDEANARVFPYLVAAYRRATDPHVRAYVLSLLPGVHPVLDSVNAAALRRLFAEALDDPDERVVATAVEAAGNSVLASQAIDEVGSLIERRVADALRATGVRVRANAHVALIKTSRGPDRLDVLERLVEDEALRGSLLYAFEVLTHTVPLASIATGAEAARRLEAVIRRLLNLWMERRCRLSARAVSRLLAALQNEARPA